MQIMQRPGENLGNERKGAEMQVSLRIALEGVERGYLTLDCAKQLEAGACSLFIPRSRH